MEKKIAEIFIDEGEITTVRIDFGEGYDVLRKLGVLEAAKTSIMNASDEEIALSKYNAEEL